MREGSEERRSANGRLAEEARTRIALDALDRVEDPTVLVDFAEREALSPVEWAQAQRNPVFCNAACTSAWVSEGSVASAAGGLPAIALIQATAWCASTETIFAATASVGFVRFVAWPL